MAMMIRKIRLAGALALVFLSPDIAAAEGALAIGATSPIVQGGLAYGFVRNFSAARRRRRPLPSTPAESWPTCRRPPRAAASSACSPTNVSRSRFTPQAAPTGFGWAIEADRQMAIRKAMDGCAGMAGDDAESCRIVQSRCDGTTLSDQCGGRAGASPEPAHRQLHRADRVRRRERQRSCQRPRQSRQRPFGCPGVRRRDRWTMTMRSSATPPTRSRSTIAAPPIG